MRDSRLLSHATLIHSAFHLSYNMLLNQMRCEDGDPEKLLRNSFYQFQSDRALPNLEVSRYQLNLNFFIFVFFSIMVLEGEP